MTTPATMRLMTAVIALSSCLGCFVERDIGGAAAVPGAANGSQIPPTRYPPPPFSNDPCCLVRQQMVLDSVDPEVPASPPSVVWRDRGPWVVTWQDSKQRRPVYGWVGDQSGTLRSLDLATPDLIPTDITHFLDRLAVALKASGRSTSPRRDPNVRVAVLDDLGALRGEASIPGGSEGGALVRWPAVHSLALLAVDHSQEGPLDRARLWLLDDDLTPLGDPVDLGPSLPDDSFGPSVLEVYPHLVTVIAAPDGVHLRSFAGPRHEPNAEVIIDVGTTTDPDAPLGRSPVGSVSAAVVWDKVIIAAMDRQTIRTWVYQPATGSVLGGPFTVGSSKHYGRLNMGGGEAGPTAGLCYSVGDGPGDPDGLQFALVAADGRPRGVPVTVATGLDHVAACDVAAGGTDRYLVTYWNAAKATARPFILANQIIVQRGTASVE